MGTNITKFNKNSVNWDKIESSKLPKQSNEYNNLKKSGLKNNSIRDIELEQIDENSYLTSEDFISNELVGKGNMFISKADTPNIENQAPQNLETTDANIYQNIVSIDSLNHMNSLLEDAINEIQKKIQELESNSSASNNTEKIKQLKDEMASLTQLQTQIKQEIELQPYREITNSKDFQDFVKEPKDYKFDTEDLIAKGYDVNLYYKEHLKAAGNDGPYAIDNIEELNQYEIFEFIAKECGDKMNINSIQALGNSSLLNGIGPNGEKYSNPANNYFFMTEEQKNIYNYLFETEGKQSAEYYISLIQDEINMKSGAYSASQFIQNLDLSNSEAAKETLLDHLKVSGKGLIDGIDSFLTGLNNSIIANEQLEASDYEKMYILQYLKENSFLLDENYEFSQSMGNMIPAMTAGTVISCFGTPVAGSMVGSALMGLSAEGNAYRQAKIEGHDELESRIYGIMKGSSEAILGYLLGKIPGISQASGFTLKNLFMEGVEEFSQEWIDAGLQAVILGDDVDWSKVPENAMKSFIMGIMMAGIMNGGSAIVKLYGKATTIDVEKTLDCIEAYPEMSIEDSFVMANSNGNTDMLLQRIYDNGGKYGISQDVLTTLINKDHEYFEQLKTKMIEKYGFREDQIQRIFFLIDNGGGGACTYARNANVILDYFKDKPAQFEKIFGFPLYRQNSEGKIVLNDAELLLDIYYWGNAVNENGQIFEVGEDGKLSLKDPSQWTNADGSTYFPQRGSSFRDLQNYLRYKSDNISIDTEVFLDNITGQNQYSREEMQSEIERRLAQGESLSMCFSPMDGAFQLPNMNKESDIYAVNSGHWVKIVGATEDGIIVTSWGEKCLIKYDDLTSGNGSYRFINDKITVSENS